MFVGVIVIAPFTDRTPSEKGIPLMEIHITAWHETATCTWCEKQKEAITANFADGFLRDATLCWRCLEKAVKVRSRQPDTPAVVKPKIGT